MRRERLVRPVAGLLLVLVFASDLRAEHEHDHRYRIEGYVLDASEQPRVDVPVSAEIPNGASASTRTDRSGHYSVRLHLHDEDIGKQIRLRAGEHAATVRMTATAGDTDTERVHHANFIGERLVEQPMGRARVPDWAYQSAAAVALLALIMGLAVWAERRRKRRHREQIRARVDAGREAAPRRRRRKRRRH